MENDGLLTIQSSYSVDKNVLRLERIFYENQVTVFAKIDHSKSASETNLSLRDTIVLFFGAPHIGTLLIQENQHIGIDLPSKVLVWEDAESNVWLTRNQTSWLIQRHDVKENSTSLELENKISKLLNKAVTK